MDAFKKHTIPITKTARYFTLGEASPDTEEIWFVLHGYGQLASYFIRQFEVLNNGKRLIVAPEALSRFYAGRDPVRVGATWMTKVDREQDIQDYLAYLNQVASHMMDLVESRKKPITVLGFSQGATTASRWVTEGRLPARRLILWAGAVAHDLDLKVHGPTLSSMQPQFVVGDKDHYITPEKLAEEQARMAAENVAVTYVPFDGPHKIDKQVLRNLAEGTGTENQD